MIVILDSPVSNSRAIYFAYTQLGIPVKVSNSLDDLHEAKGIILPGIGSFGGLSDSIKENGFVESLRLLLTQRKKFLGVCLGSQFMTISSDEAPSASGLGFFNTSCKKLPKSSRVPHVGWNDVMIQHEHPIFKGLPETFQAYFSHSYYIPILPNETIATSVNGLLFSSVITNSFAVGIQFHPERSQRLGLQLLKNFADWL
jgi:imidazole glycerol-phosphate synthase subunit HisH